MLLAFTTTSETALWQEALLISPREQSRATFDREPHAGINEIVHYPLGYRTIKLPLLTAMDNQPQGATDRKAISFSDACSSTFINYRDPAVY